MGVFDDHRRDDKKFDLERFDPLRNILMSTLTYRERAEMLRHCKWVDKVIKAKKSQIDESFISRHNIHYVASFDSDDGLTNP